MDLVITILIDGALLVGVLISVSMAAFYGELCGIEPGRDKSGLGGFAFAYLFMLMRWPLVAAGLLIGHARGAIPYLPPDWPWWSLVLAHAALGAIAAVAFGRGVDHVHADRRLPAAFGVLFGVLLPLPGWLAAIVGTNTTWLGNDVSTLGIVAGLLLACHGLPFRARLRGMRQMAARLAQATAPAEGPPGDLPH